MTDLTQGRPFKTILLFSIPIFLGNILQICYNLADLRIVGGFLGDDALASVGATSTLSDLTVGFQFGLANGFGVIAARHFGAGNRDEVRRTFACSLKLGVIISILLSLISIIFIDPILELLKVPEQYMADGRAYIQVILAGLIFGMFYNIFAGILRSIGDSLFPLIILGIAIVLNVILDIVVIGIFKTGVSGAAYATVISQVLSAVLCFIYTEHKYDFLRLRREDFRSDRSLISHLLESGLSMGFMNSLVSLGSVVLQSAINSLGGNIIVAHTAARKISSIFMLPMMAWANAITTYTGQNAGAGKYKRVFEGIKKSVYGCWIWTVFVIIAAYTITPVIVRMITATDSSEVIDTASLYLRFNTCFYFILPVITIFRNALQGLGDHRTPVISSSIEMIGKIGAALAFTPLLGYWGIIISEPFVWTFMVIPLIIKMYKIKRSRIK